MNQNIINIAKQALINTDINVIATNLGTTKLAVLGAYGTLKRNGLATYENNQLVLTEAGIAQFGDQPAPVTLEGLVANVGVDNTTIGSDVA